jgi:DNA-binding transcriptional LysR family regulator
MKLLSDEARKAATASCSAGSAMRRSGVIAAKAFWPFSPNADFVSLHPDIEMEILPSSELANLTNRDADVAIRVVYDRKGLPLNLH